MSARIGWLLAALALAVGYASGGWPGLVLGITVTVFVLLLQFNRALRVMRQAARAPVGLVPSTVMLQARLERGMQLLDVVRLSGSLGSPLADDGRRARYGWRDPGGACLQADFERGRLVGWALERPAGSDA